MKRIVLFSLPTSKNKERLLNLIFPDKLQNKKLVFIPSDGNNIKQKYLNEWSAFAKDGNAEFTVVDNSKVNSTDEVDKIKNANILVLSGGNTFKFLDSLRKSKLDLAIKEFIKKDEFVLVGFSAGAIVLTPTIEVCNLPNYDSNDVEMKDLTGLGIIDFEVFPHYSEKYKKGLRDYTSKTDRKVKKIADDDVIVVDL